MRRAAASLAVTAALLAAGCSTPAPRGKDGPPDAVPADVTRIPDAVPEPVTKAAVGNPRWYEVYGKRYYVLDTAVGYRQRGKASWYGRKFHGRKTSSGETYNMFAMTAAHKTLPIPCYVRVTNPGNGKSVVVKVNDRGPFHSDRIIDLSYTAATRLDIVSQGSAMVEVETVDPNKPVRASSPPAAFLEVGAYADPINAVSMREEIVGLGIGAVQIRTEERSDETLHHVVIGPFTDHAVYEKVRQQLVANQLPVRPVTD